MGKVEVGYDVRIIMVACMLLHTPALLHMQCELDRQEKALMEEVREGREKRQKEKKALSEKEKSGNAD